MKRSIILKRACVNFILFDLKLVCKQESSRNLWESLIENIFWFPILVKYEIMISFNFLRSYIKENFKIFCSEFWVGSGCQVSEISEGWAWRFTRKGMNISLANLSVPEADHSERRGLWIGISETWFTKQFNRFNELWLFMKYL